MYLWRVYYRGKTVPATLGMVLAMDEQAAIRKGVGRIRDQCLEPSQTDGHADLATPYPRTLIAMK